MATYYVDSVNGGDPGDGLTPATAWKSIESSTGVAAGDLVLVGSGHTEPSKGTTSIAWSLGTKGNPVIVCSANLPAGTYASRGAVLMNNTSGGGDITFGGNVIIRGCRFLSDSGGRFKTAALTAMRFYDCEVNLTNIEIRLGGSNSVIYFTKCDFTSDYLLFLNAEGSTYFKNCVFETASANYILSLQTRENLTDFDACDFSQSASPKLIDGYESQRQTQVNFRNSELNGPIAIDQHTVAERAYIRFHNCAAGTISAPVIGITHWTDYWGTTKGDPAVYRDGGASDGETPISWQMQSTANTITDRLRMESPPMVRWVEAGAQTLTIYYANESVGTDLYDNEFWIEVQSPNETGSPNQTAQSKFQSTRTAPLATALLNDDDTGSTWNGSYSNPQSISVSINPTEPGPVTVRCFLAKPNTKVFVDPKIGVA